MVIASKLLAAIAALTQLAGILLLAGQARAAKRELAEMRRANPEGHHGGSYGSQMPAYEAIRRLLGEQAHPRWAVGLLVIATLSGLVSALVA